MEFKIAKNFYCWDKGKLFYKDHYEFSPNKITYLIGPNGSGKSTLLFATEDKLSRTKVLCIRIRDMDTDSFYGLGGDFVTQFASSEGQARQARILGQFGDAVRRAKRKINDYDEVMFLIDSLDSGMSVDCCIEARQALEKTIIPDLNKLEKPWYLIITANQYELIKGSENCLALPILEYVSIKTYEEYVDLILQLKKKSY